MLVFGVVPANFRQVEAPKVDCKVLSTVKGGSSFTNNADVGGVYNGQWIQAVTRWTTKVYGKPPKLPTTLVGGQPQGCRGGVQRVILRRGQVIVHGHPRHRVRDLSLPHREPGGHRPHR